MGLLPMERGHLVEVFHVHILCEIGTIRVRHGQHRSVAPALRIHLSLEVLRSQKWGHHVGLWHERGCRVRHGIDVEHSEPDPSCARREEGHLELLVLHRQVGQDHLGHVVAEAHHLDLRLELLQVLYHLVQHRSLIGLACFGHQPLQGLHLLVYPISTSPL